MSAERHPNINAAGFTTEILLSYLKHLRGPARDHLESESIILMKEHLIEFVAQTSTSLDRAYGVTNGEAKDQKHVLALATSNGSPRTKEGISQKLRKLFVHYVLRKG